MSHRWINTLICSLLLWLPTTLAEDIFSASSGIDLLASNIEFLPVEEAYQLAPIVDDQQLQLNWEIQPGYYLYKHRFKLLDTALTPIDTTPEYQQGKRIYDEYYEKELEVYYQHTVITLPLTELPKDFIVESQGCADAGLCYPPRQQKVTLDHNGAVALVSEYTPLSGNQAGNVSASPITTGSLPLMLLFAMLGGIILNLMPCVFPVLSIKALSLANTHANTHSKHLHGLAYTLGIVLSFMAIAALLMLLRRAGEAIGWGFQLQSPVFVGLLIYLFILMGLSFSGLLTFGTRLMNIGQSATQGQGLTASFMTGLLATLVASPCTAPFMGTALGFALAQPIVVSLSVFAALGVGMALPLLLLSWWPGLADKLPRPGAWMERFKEFLAFPLYLTAAWLLWVLGRQAGSDTVVALITGIILLLFALWLLRVRKNTLTTITALAAISFALLLPWQTHSNNEVNPPWEPYSETKLEELKREGNAVFVNLTADWCITCLANEKLALRSERFLSTLKTQQITYLKGDWTNYNPEITKLLNQHQRSGVPLYLFYPKGDDKPQILPQLLTEKIVINAITPRSNQN